MGQEVSIAGASPDRVRALREEGRKEASGISFSLKQ
jgi:hypothetical protein